MWLLFFLDLQVCLYFRVYASIKLSVNQSFALRLNSVLSQCDTWRFQYSIERDGRAQWYSPRLMVHFCIRPPTFEKYVLEMKFVVSNNK